MRESQGKCFVTFGLLHLETGHAAVNFRGQAGRVAKLAKVTGMQMCHVDGRERVLRIETAPLTCKTTR